MFAFLLQDWVTIRAGSGAAVTQGEANWLDFSGFLDIVAFVETKNVTASTGSVYCGFQTSPTKDDILFQSMNLVDPLNSASVPLSIGVQTFILLRDTALCPLAQWLRWQLTAPTGGVTSYEATFRIWVAANQPGGFARTSGMALGDGKSAGVGGAGGPDWTQGPAIGSPTAPPPNLLTKTALGTSLYGQGPMPRPREQASSLGTTLHHMGYKDTASSLGGPHYRIGIPKYDPYWKRYQHITAPVGAFRIIVPLNTGDPPMKKG